MRWAGILRELGHGVHVTGSWDGRACDLLIALHAQRSSDSVHAFRRRFPERPLVIALTGTDLYRDLPRSRRTVRSMEEADRLITLHALAYRRVPARLRSKIRLIYQSVRSSASASRPRLAFDVCVMCHMRPLKDPFRAALASRLLHEDSRIRVLHVGRALSPAMETRARREESRNPRYRWVGELPRWKALRVLAGCSLMVVSSRMEGGANVVGEAIAASVPVLASRIPGNVGLLGKDYPGYYRLGDTRGLARLLRRAETDPVFMRRLETHSRRRRPLLSPVREKRAWRRLLEELAQEASTSR